VKKHRSEFGPFLHDLDLVSRAPASALNSKTFLKDLDRVLTRTSSDLGLDQLAKVFDGLVVDAVRRIGGRGWYEKLPPSDPLCGRVSLFGTLDWGLRETAHTRALAWFFDPEGDHGFGKVLLAAVLKEVFRLNQAPLLSDCIIQSELPAEDGRDRLDIRMRGKWLVSGCQETWSVILEAKIAAEEGAEQCARYESHGRRGAADNQAFIFLTPNGLRPTTGSNRRRIEWLPLSFVQLAALFREHLHELEGSAGFDFLRLYMTGILKDVYSIDCGRITDRADLYRIQEYLNCRERETTNHG